MRIKILSIIIIVILFIALYINADFRKPSPDRVSIREVFNIEGGSYYTASFNKLGLDTGDTLEIMIIPHKKTYSRFKIKGDNQRVLVFENCTISDSGDTKTMTNRNRNCSYNAKCTMSSNPNIADYGDLIDKLVFKEIYQSDVWEYKNDVITVLRIISLVDSNDIMAKISFAEPRN